MATLVPPGAARRRAINSGGRRRKPAVRLVPRARLARQLAEVASHLGREAGRNFPPQTSARRCFLFVTPTKYPLQGDPSMSENFRVLSRCLLSLAFVVLVATSQAAPAQTVMMTGNWTASVEEKSDK